MRQGKLSELIHNSDRYPNLAECSVEVHFREIIDLVRSRRVQLHLSITFNLAWSRQLHRCPQLRHCSIKDRFPE
jgi:hypothetical protein